MSNNCSKHGNRETRSGCPECMPWLQQRGTPDALALLTDLVNALNSTTWSSWQATHRFDGPLRAANDYLDGLPT